jgi:hypothetical protein
VNREIKLAWAAGFIDGEGCISIYHQRGYYLVLTVSQKSKKPLLELQKIFGGKLYNVRNKKYWMWTLWGENAVPALVEMLPFLVLKKEQAKLAIKFQTAKPEPIAGNQRAKITPQRLASEKEMYVQMRELKL